MRKRRRLRKGEVYFVTGRTARGLPFVANKLVRLLINGIVARCCELYPAVRVCHFVFLGNHYHALVVLNGSAEQMSRFFGYLDGQLASLFNRLTKTAHRKFWATRYDAKPVLDAEAVIDKIAYIYLNPVKALLVEEAQEWEGASSYSQFLDEQPRQYQWISSSLVERVPNGPLSERYMERYLAGLNRTKRAARELMLDPHAWSGCFCESRRWTKKYIKSRILERITEQEREYRMQRKHSGCTVMGVERLRRESVYKDYVSKTYRRNSLCITSCDELRREYKAIYRAFCELCREVWRRWQQNDFSLSLPPGAFVPPMMPRASIFVPI